ncbi:hypothetical protein TL16_g01733 [Triparma laevis f. inornata]|uniref:Uncharacterized protein n=1 Tax=Triparma laevis f. inornata TaxID=1714386 RepID=A0A9W6ZQQ6_9STRA|nr:hypothetical protein TL16_g01733 [Triparma laevis f. inornata]
MFSNSPSFKSHLLQSLSISAEPFGSCTCEKLLVSGTYVFANMKSADNNHDAEHAIVLAARDAIYAELVAVNGLKTGHSMYEIFLPSIFDPSVWRISVRNTNKRSRPVYYYSLRDRMSSSAGEGPDKLKGLRSALDLNCKILDGRIELWEVKTSNKKRKGETLKALAEKKKKASLANKPSAVQEEFQEAYIKQEIAYQNFKKELHLQNGHNEL